MATRILSAITDPEYKTWIGDEGKGNGLYDKQGKSVNNFRRDAALAIINKLERYNGCILADIDSLFSVGETTALRGEKKRTGRL